MKMSLRVRLLGTIVGAIIVCFIVSVVAARLVLQRDLMDLGRTEVSNGSNAFAGYWDSRKDQIRLLIAQEAVSDALRKSVQTHNVKALEDSLNNAARTSGLSFLTIVDPNGKVIARANGSTPGSLFSDPYVQRALTGESISSAALLSPSELQGEGLAGQAASDVKTGGKTEHVDKGLAIVALAPMSDANERTIGAIYGGIVLNHFYDLVDQSTHSLGGQTALMDGDDIVASTISQQDGTRVVDSQVTLFKQVTADKPYIGPDMQGGTEYLAQITPITNDQNEVIGARWYGIPMSQITDIQNHTTQTLAFWGIVAMLVALLLAVPLVQRISAAIAKRSEQVSAAAKELGVTIVGGEVSGDHVTATKAAVERAAALIDDIGKTSDAAKVAELRTVNDELQSDMIVIDTLSQEMANRLQQAVNRVAELNDVANALDALVHGAK